VRRIALLLLLATAAAAEPPRCERLFSIRRSVDRNEVVYEACFEGIRPAADRPVRAHWEMYATDGHHEDLTAFEEAFAFGVDASVAADGAFSFVLRAARDRRIEVRGAGQDARAVLPIGGVDAVLLDIFVEVAQMAFIPRVRWVELGGMTVATGTQISQRLQP
jgi:hypothetical protein